MKTLYVISGIFLFTLVSWTNCIIAQNISYDFQNYTPPASTGKIPLDFLKTVTQKYTEDITPFQNLQNKTEKKLKEEYYLKIHNSLNDILLSGYVTFNDPISNYVTKVYNHIKEKNPDIPQDVRFYSLKSPYLNASATETGIVFINIGALAYMENEAQLAFFICHEISHISGHDNIESFIEQKKVLKGKGAYGSLSFDEKIDALFLHDKTIEFKADSNAISLYLNSGYDPNQIPKAFDIIHYSYLPFQNTPFSKTFFNNGSFQIPDIFFKNELDPINSTMDYKDIYHSHPNVYKRKEAVKRILSKTQNTNGAMFFSDEQELYAVRDIARFEVVRLLLLNKNYTESIYNAYVLLKSYPENQFLLNSVAKALYGLAKFRNTDEYHLVTSSYSKIEGESQQLHYLFRQLNKVQLNVLAINYINSLLEKDSENKILNEMQKELIYELIYYHDVSFDKFYNEPKIFTNSSQYIKNNLSSTEIAQAQKEVGLFYLNAFCNKKNDNNLMQIFSQAEKDAKKKKDEDALSYIERQELKEEKEKKILKEGISCKNGKVLILDPIYVSFDSNWKEDVLKSEKEKILLDEYIKEYINKTNNNKITLLSSNSFSANNIEDYNIASLYKEMVQEILTKKICKLKPLSNDFVVQSSTNGIEILCIPGMYRLKSKWYYSMSFFDLSKNNLVYSYTESIAGPNVAKKSITKDLSILKF